MATKNHHVGGAGKMETKMSSSPTTTRCCFSPQQAPEARETMFFENWIEPMKVEQSIFFHNFAKRCVASSID